MRTERRPSERRRASPSLTACELPDMGIWEPASERASFFIMMIMFSSFMMVVSLFPPPLRLSPTI